MAPTKTIGMFALVLALLGCTHVAEIRTHHGTGESLPTIDTRNPGKDCDFVSRTDPKRANSIEDFGAFWASYIEFDDQGWMFTSTDQPSQVQVLQERLKKELHDPALADTDFVVVAFVHGWHHNAHDEDCNVHEFRALLKVASDDYASLYRARKIQHPRRVVGVYVGWRGESLNIDGLRYTTVLDRSNAADRVAKGDVRELFALLRKDQFLEVHGDKSRPDRMRTVVIGHSFGGLIAFHSLAPAMLNELALDKPDTDNGCRMSVRRDAQLGPGAAVGREPPAAASALSIQAYPDLLVLINPAFEATRFEALHELMRPAAGCAFPTYPASVPKVVVVTADNDFATGPLFTAERQAMTVLERFPDNDSPGHASDERYANLHAIGFLDRNVTHRLCLASGEGGQDRAAAVAFKPEKPDWDPLEPYPPVWVVRAPPSIVDGHDGFFYARPKPGSTEQEPYLLEWLINLHIQGPSDSSPAMIGTDKCKPD